MKKIFICLVFFGIIISRPVMADIGRPMEGDQATKVRVSLFIVDIDEIKTASQNFDANVYLEYRWHDPRLANDGDKEISHPLSQVWNPRIQIVNQQKVWPTFPEIVESDPSGEVVYRQRVWGSFSQPLELRDFPFDQQVFSINLAAAGYTPDEVELIPDPDMSSGIAQNLSVADWEIYDLKEIPRTFKFRPQAEGTAGFTLSFKGKRNAGYFIVKVIIPLVIILAMSWIVFWIDPKESGSQISVAITTMLTLIAYRFAVGSDLPKVSYLTRLDYFILSATVLVYASLIEVVVTSSYAKTDKLALARTIDRWSRLLFPAIFIIFTLETLIFRFWL